MIAPRPTHGYRAHDRFVVRTPLWSRSRFSALSSYESLRAAIPQLLSDDRIVAALSTASPRLVDQLRRLHEAAPFSSDERKELGALRSLRKYLLRMSNRPTPFGLFAGVALGTFGAHTDLRLEDDPIGRVEAFADFAWLMAFATSLSTGGGARRLPLTVNPYAQQIAGRLDVAQSNVFGTSVSNHVDLLVTTPVQQALTAAAEGASADEVVELLRAAHPGIAPETIEGLVDTLLTQGVLYPAVVPSLIPGNEGVPILDALTRGGAEFRVERDELDRILSSLSAVRDIEGLNATLPTARSSQSALLSDFSDSTVTVNAGLALASATLSEKVARRVEDVADVLVRTSFFPPRPASIVEYEQHFLERYGVGGEVPVLELLSASRGLEAPAGYQLPLRTYPLPGFPAPTDSAGASALLGAYTAALLSGTPLELTDDILTAYATEDTRPPSASFDLFVRVLARSAAHVDRGDFDLAVLPEGLALGGRSTGRFTGVLDDAADLVDAMLARESRHSAPDTRLVLLRYLPDKARMANVARTSAPSLDVLDVGVASDTSTGMSLADVLVGNDGSSFYLVDRRRGDRVRFVENHMLSPLSAPNVIRLLVELSTDGLRGFNIFDWGRLSGAPYLPRVVRNRVIFSPARWNIHPALLAAAEGSVGFASTLRATRDELRMPARVTLVRDDNRLPLDLDAEIDVAILAEEQSRALTSGTTLVFEESLDADEDDRDGGHPGLITDPAGASFAHELVVSVALPAPEESESPHRHPSARRTAPAGIRTSQEWDPRWVCIDVQASLADLELVLSSHLGLLLEATRSLRDRWFFVRYPLPGHALRIRLRARTPRHLDRLRTAVARWADALVAQRVVRESALTGYVPEFQRYGGEALYVKALPVFEATSRLAIALAAARATATPAEASDDVVGVALLAHLHEAIGVSHSALGVEPSTDASFRRFYRENRPALLSALRDPGEALRSVGFTETAELRLALDECRATLRAFAEAFRREHGVDDLAAAAATIMHMTFNRVYPIGNAIEPRALGLWALTAEAAARRERAFADIEPPHTDTRESVR